MLIFIALFCIAFNEPVKCLKRCLNLPSRTQVNCFNFCLLVWTFHVSFEEGDLYFCGIHSKLTGQVYF